MQEELEREISRLQGQPPQVFWCRASGGLADLKKKVASL
jgi:hypothetical protein